MITLETLQTVSLILIGFSLAWSALSLRAFYEKAAPGEHDDEGYLKSYLRGDCWLLIVGSLGLFYALFKPRAGHAAYYIVVLSILFFAPFVRTLLGLFMEWLISLKGNDE